MVSTIKIQMNFLNVENNVVPVEDILKMHNVDDTLPEVSGYNIRIWCRYIEWDI